MTRVPRHLPEPLRHLPLCLGVSAGTLLAAAGGGGLAAGRVGAAGAALGVGVVTASFLLSTLVIAGAEAVSPRLVLPFGVGIYVAKFSVLIVVAAAVTAAEWDGKAPAGVGMVAGVLAWIVPQFWRLSSGWGTPPGDQSGVT